MSNDSGISVWTMNNIEEDRILTASIVPVFISDWLWISWQKKSISVFFKITIHSICKEEPYSFRIAQTTAWEKGELDAIFDAMETKREGDAKLIKCTSPNKHKQYISPPSSNNIKLMRCSWLSFPPLLPLPFNDWQQLTLIVDIDLAAR